MILKTLVGFFIVLIGCSGNQQTSKNRLTIEDDPNQHQEWKSGLLIENGINRGIGYTDSLGNNYNIRYIPITITNDSTIPIHLHIVFSQDYDYPIEYGETQFKVIPLPKEWALDGVEVTDSMVDALQNSLNKPSLRYTLEPDEKWVFAIGTVYQPTGYGVLPNALYVQGDKPSFHECKNHLNRDSFTSNVRAQT